MSRSRLLIASGYWLAALLIALPLLQSLASLLPLRPSNLRWRLEAFGLVSHALLLPMLGTAVATGTAVLLRQRIVVRLLSTLWVLAALAIAAAAVVFALDLVQYHGAVGMDLRRHYATTGLTYLLSALLQTAFLLWLAAAVWRAAARSRSVRSVERSRRPPPQPSPAPGDGSSAG